jgi:hypothetical protein
MGIFCALVTAFVKKDMYLNQFRHVLLNASLFVTNQIDWRHVYFIESSAAAVSFF